MTPEERCESCWNRRYRAVFACAINGDRNIRVCFRKKCMEYAADEMYKHLTSERGPLCCMSQVSVAALEANCKRADTRKQAKTRRQKRHLQSVPIRNGNGSEDQQQTQGKSTQEEGQGSPRPQLTLVHQAGDGSR